MWSECGLELLLKDCGHLGQLGDGVHVAGCAFFGGGDFEAGVGHAWTVVDVDFAQAQLDFFVPLPGGVVESVGWRGLVEEDGYGGVRWSVGEGICGEDGGHLGCGSDDDADGFAGVVGQASLEG
jgi:hypothetical protein